METVENLIEVIKTSDFSEFLRLVKDSPDLLNESTSWGDTPLIHSIKENNVKTIDYIIKSTNVNINHRTKVGMTALLFAVQKEQIETVRTLLKYGAKFENNKITTMTFRKHFSILSDDIIDELLETDLRIESIVDAIVLSESPRYIEKLIDNGYDVTENLAQIGGGEHLEIFIKSVPTNDQICRAVLKNIEKSRYKNAMLLLEYCDYANITNEKGQTLLMLISGGEFRISGRQIKIGLCEDKYFLTDLFNFFIYSASSNMGTDYYQRKIFDKIIVVECSINHVDNFGQTALFYAIKNEDIYYATELIKAGADVNIYDNNNVSPLMLALIGRNSLEYVKLIVNNNGRIGIEIRELKRYKHIITFLKSVYNKQDIEELDDTLKYLKEVIINEWGYSKAIVDQLFEFI